jgi:hypothetical protein
LTVVACIAGLAGAGLWWRHTRTSGQLRAGDYRLSMTATSGSRRGNAVEGHLTLVRTAESDRSPRTGEQPKPSDSRYLPFYGWTDADLSQVGAPLCLDGPAPPPSSRDPVFPGVLVLQLPPGMKLATPVQRPMQAPILVTGTGRNIRDGGRRLDGCGIGLFVQSHERNCVRGEWAEWGLEADGRGTFALCP